MSAPTGAAGPAPTTSSSAPPASSSDPRKPLAIASRGLDLRGQQDALGFASRPEQMAKTWELSAFPPPPEGFGPVPRPGVAGVICPHDDYLYAGRVYRATLPLVTAKRVVVVGVFHRYAKFGIRDRLVLDAYRAWRAPDGEVPVSSLRADVLGQMCRARTLTTRSTRSRRSSIGSATLVPTWRSCRSSYQR
jgi:hypothetical protein